MLKDFKAFLLRGNVVDLAVGVVIGAAFGAVVDGTRHGPVHADHRGDHRQAGLRRLTFTINGSHFLYGDFLNALIAFVSIAAAVFFFVVRPVNALMARRKTAARRRLRNRPCPECLSDIPRLARRCAFCTAEVGPATAGA